MCYSEFQKIEQIVDCSEFRQAFENFMVYMKMTGENTNFNEDDVFNWMGLIDVGHYRDDDIKDDIWASGDWDDDNFDLIKSKIEDLNQLLYSCLYEFDKKTGITIYFEYDSDEYFSYFDFRASQVLDVMVNINKNESVTN